MSGPMEEPQEQSALKLIRGILVDLEHLFVQQLQLTRKEIEQEVRERSVAAAFVVSGFLFFFLAAIVVCLTFAHLLHWATSPSGTDPAQVPLWGCHAIIATLLLVAGGILAQIGRLRLKSVTRCENPVTVLLQEPER